MKKKKNKVNNNTKNKLFFYLLKNLNYISFKIKLFLF